jgi:hypothetical protein
MSAAALGVLLLLAEHGADRSKCSVLAAGQTPRWYRGNIHTHSLWSDGDDYPEMIAIWYKEHGYEFLSFSDHNTLQEGQRWIDALMAKKGAQALARLKARFPEHWVEERTSETGRLEVRLKTHEELAAELASPGKFLLLKGEEISDHFRECPVHLNATNLRELVPPMGGDSVYDVMQRNVDAIVAQRERTGQAMIVHLNHPNFHFGITAEELARVRGENFFEVYNGHTQVDNDGDELHASAERIWDIILTQRIARLRLPLMFGLATDDSHDYHDMPSRGNEPGRGWIFVLARELSPDEIIRALDRGDFYASTGVRLSRIATSEKGIDVAVEVEPGIDYTIDFIGTRRGYDPATEPVKDRRGIPRRVTRRYSNDIGRVLKTQTGARATYRFDDDDLYVRARVTSTRRHPNPSAPGEYERAWCQPALGPAGRTAQ